MNKSNARKILSAQARINAIVAKLGETLTGDELAYFENYWGAELRRIMNDGGYGAAPTFRAEKALENSSN